MFFMSEWRGHKERRAVYDAETGDHSAVSGIYRRGCHLAEPAAQKEMKAGRIMTGKKEGCAVKEQEVRKETDLQGLRELVRQLEDGQMLTVSLGEEEDDA